MLLAVQGCTLFAAVPLGAVFGVEAVVLDVSRCAFAAVCAVVLTRHAVVRGALLAGVFVLVVGPALTAHTAGVAAALHLAVLAVAFVFTGVVTALVTRQVFGPGRVTGHRVQGAVLVYLNLASLFAIAYSALVVRLPDAIAHVTPVAGGTRTAELTYFSLTTLTTSGYGDLVPVHPLARSLATLEAVVGQLFPATLLARLMSRYTAQAAARSRVAPAPATRVEHERDRDSE